MPELFATTGDGISLERTRYLKGDNTDMSREVMRQVKVRANLDPDFRSQFMKSPLKFLSGYDLTEDEKRQIILPNFGWLVDRKLGALAYPESEDAFILLRRLGI